MVEPVVILPARLRDLFQHSIEISIWYLVFITAMGILISNESAGKRLTLALSRTPVRGGNPPPKLFFSLPPVSNLRLSLGVSAWPGAVL